MFRAHIGAQFSILIIPHFALFCKCRAKADFEPFTFGLFTSPAARERTSPQT